MILINLYKYLFEIGLAKFINLFKKSTLIKNIFNTRMMQMYYI